MAPRREVTETGRGATTSGGTRRQHRDNPDAYIAGDRRRALGAGIEMRDRVRGAAIFADISGFTPLTEALAHELGAQRGAEELTAALDVVFDAVLGQLHRHGGSVIYFSGDAVTCWLDGDDGLRAVACAHAMQAAMAKVCRITTPGGGDVELGMKVAVAAGPARRFVVGDPNIQLVDVLAGSLMDRLAAAEHHAVRGEVVVDGGTLDALGERVELAEVRGEGDERAGVVTGVLGMTAPLPAAQPYPKLPRATVRRWLLPAVYERMSTGRGEFLSELRPAVPMFVRFGGIDYDHDEDAPERLDDFVKKAQWLVDSHGGNVLQLTIGDKGAYLYAVFGSPLAHEDDAARACAASLGMLDLESETAATGLQIGLAKGRLRSGTYGHRQRRTFCCLGDAVNLSARLMSNAPPGQIYVTPEVAKAAASHFEFEELGAITVKGKAAPIAVRRLVAHHEHREPRRLRVLQPLIGRGSELDRLVGLAEEALSGRGQLVGVSAEAGMGKSSLAAALAEILGDRGVPVLIGAAASVGSAISYLAWQPVLNALFGLSHDRSETPGELTEKLEAALAAIDPGLVPRMPLLGAALGVAIDDNELTASFDAKLRKTSLESLLVHVVCARATAAPIAVVLEDGHWLDPLSTDLLELVARAAATVPLFLLVTYRPGSFSAPALDHTTVVALERLDEASCRAILSARLGDLFGAGHVPAESLVSRLVSRAGGNPFYLGELANYLHDQGADPADPAAAAMELPSSLSSLVLSRIDTLDEAARRTLKVASVVGREFDVAMLAGAYPTLGGGRQVLGALRALVAEDLVIAEDGSADLYAFRHAVVQEVAYESLPFAMRATVHGRVGTWLEATDPDALDLLAHHFWHSREEPKKREYLRKAGDAAKARYANDAAIEYFRRLAPLVRDVEREEVLTQLGSVLAIGGDWAETEAVYRQVVDLATGRGDGAAAGRAHVSICEPMISKGQFVEARAELDIAERLFQGASDLAGLSRVTHFRGWIANQAGEPEVASHHLERSLGVRRELGDKAGMATTLNNLAISAGHRGDYPMATRLFEECLALQTELGDRRYMCASHLNLGMVAYLQRDYEKGVAHLEQAVRLGTEVGCLTAATARENLGNCLRELGDASGALHEYTRALEAYAAAASQYNLCYLFEDVAIVWVAARPESTSRLLGAANALREAIGAPRMDYEQAAVDERTAAAREHLGEERFARELAAGAELPLDAAISLCRELCATPVSGPRTASEGQVRVTSGLQTS